MSFRVDPSKQTDPAAIISRVESSQIPKINELYVQASKEPDLDKKRVIYNEIFQLLRKEPQHSQQLFRLFEEYASKTCYAQESKVKDDKGESIDDEEGFRKCARLLELSLCLQLNEMNFAKYEYDWQKFDDLESLITSLQYQKGEEGLFFGALNQLKMDSHALAQLADRHGNGEILAKSLLKLAYSYQNIESLNSSTPEHLAFHKHYDELVEQAIGKNTEEQKQTLVSYRYNRCGFIVALQDPKNFQGKLDGYSTVLTLAQEIYPKDSPDLTSIAAQVANQRGLITIRAETPKPGFLEAAQPYFEEAIRLRTSILNKFSDPEKNMDQEFLLSNARTGLIHCLVTKEPLTKENVDAAKGHAKALQERLDVAKSQNRAHNYYGSWERAIAKVDAAEKKIKA